RPSPPARASSIRCPGPLATSSLFDNPTSTNRQARDGPRPLAWARLLAATQGRAHPRAPERRTPRGAERTHLPIWQPRRHPLPVLPGPDSRLAPDETNPIRQPASDETTPGTRPKPLAPKHKKQPPPLHWG